MKRHLLSRLLFLGCLLPGLLISCGLGGKLTDATPPQESIITINPVVPTANATPANPQIPEQRELVLEWPEKIRLGDSGIVRLTLKMDREGQLAATAEIEGSAVKTTPVEVPNLYNTHTVQAQARLDLGGVRISPAETFSQALLPGEEVTFLWSVHPEEVGRYHGTVWFGLRFLPKSGGEAIERQLSAQIIEMESVKFIGVSGPMARVLGGLGTILSWLIGPKDVLPAGRKVLLWLRKLVHR